MYPRALVELLSPGLRASEYDTSKRTPLSTMVAQRGAAGEQVARQFRRPGRSRALLRAVEVVDPPALQEAEENESR